MIVKVAIAWIGKYGDIQFIARGKKIIKAMTNNPNFTSPPPSPEIPILEAAMGEFESAFADSIDGGLVQTALKKQLRLGVENLYRELAAYVQVACHGNMVILLSSGFPAQKTEHTPVGDLATPGNLILTHAGHGALTGSFDSVFGATVYNWRLTSTSPGAVGQVWQGTPTSHTFTGLVPGATYTLEVCAGGTADKLSDWSNPVSLIVD